MKIAKKTSIKDDPSDCGERLILYDSDWANPQKIIKASKYITRTYTHRVPLRLSAHTSPRPRRTWTL